MNWMDMGKIRRIGAVLLVVSAAMAHAEDAPSQLVRLPYNNPGLVVDLGVGLWALPLPMDYDEDGDLDLVVVTPDVPSKGAYFFENPDGSVFPTFKPGRIVADGPRNATVSYVDGQRHVMTPGMVYPDFRNTGFAAPVEFPVKPDTGDRRMRENQWKYADYDGDGNTDLVVGLAEWTEYGWDDAYNGKGEWTRGPLRGWVFVARNTATNTAPHYAPFEQVLAAGKPVDVYGAPSPNFADFDADGDFDLLCGSFLDTFTYFQNTGSRTAPEYASGVELPHRMDLEMLQVIALDWDKDGDVDLVVGQEDGRVAWLEHTGSVTSGVPAFKAPVFFRQEAEYVKTGALSTPYSFDWDHDGDPDLIAGDTAGYINLIENLDGGNPPKWAAPNYLQAGDETIRIQAGPNGSIQGPAEAKWGYTSPNVADWNHDGLPDIVVNSIWGAVVWYQNEGTLEAPKLKAAQNVEVAWEGETPKPAWTWWKPEGKQLVTQWRTTPHVRDWNEDGLNDLIMLDTEGYLVLFARKKEGDTLTLLPPARIFQDEMGNPFHINAEKTGRSGRRQFTTVDWDGDGLIDILKDGANIDFLRNLGDNKFQNMGPLDSRKLAGHTTCPAVVDWDKNGVPDLVIGAEDGFYYYLKNPRP